MGGLLPEQCGHHWYEPLAVLCHGPQHADSHFAVYQVNKLLIY